MGAGGPMCRFFCEIGDAPGSGRPGDIRDKQSIRCPHAGFGPPLFNDIPPIIVVARLNARHILRILRDKVGIYHIPYGGLIFKLRPYQVNDPPAQAGAYLPVTGMEVFRHRNSAPYQVNAHAKIFYYVW